MSDKNVREVHAPYVVDMKEIRRETVIIHENNVPVAVMMPFGEYQQLLRQAKTEQIPEQKGNPAFERNRAAFKRMLPELLKDHEGEWVGMINEEPAVFGSSSRAVLNSIVEKYGDISVYIQEIRDTPRVYNIPSVKKITRL
jgi:hypothetical protein